MSAGNPHASDWPLRLIVTPLSDTIHVGDLSSSPGDHPAFTATGAISRMTEGTLERLIQQSLQMPSDSSIEFIWHVPDPTLLELEFFHKVIQYQDRHVLDRRAVLNTVLTDAIDLNAAWLTFFAAHDFLVETRLLGYQLFEGRNGHGRSNEAWIDGLRRCNRTIRSHHGSHKIRCVVDRRTSQFPLELYHLFKDLSIEWIEFVPLIDPEAGEFDSSPSGRKDRSSARYNRTSTSRAPLPKWARDRLGEARRTESRYREVLRHSSNTAVSVTGVDPEAYGQFLCDVFDEWVRHDVGRVTVEVFDRCIETLLYGSARDFGDSHTSQDRIAVDHAGNVYTCDGFLYSGSKRGNIFESPLATFIDDDDQQAFESIGPLGKARRCRECVVRSYCNGGSPTNPHRRSRQDDNSLTYLCDGYKLFFMYIQPYLDCFAQTIAHGEPLSKVTHWIETLDGSERSWA